MNILSKNDIKNILNARFSGDQHKRLCDLPMPNCLKDVYKAANRIKDAINKNEKVAIVGDYDVDGVISCVILSEFFDDIGFDYVVKIPNRFKDGYGINEEIINELDASLIITVDNGICAVEAAELCKQKGIDLIITDHHTPLEILPQAYAIINPKQKDCNFPDIEICGAEVAWYLLAALKDVCKLKYDMCNFLELLSIAIVADMMELRDLNRALVKQGLKNLNTSKRPAFKAIKHLFKKDFFEADSLGFLIAPLINSAGRMDDASISYKFLHTKDFNESLAYLEQIVLFNESRKDEEKQLFAQSLEKVNKNDSVIFVSGQDWHEGVLGIVASRLARHFNKPSFVFCEMQNRAKGSARSVGKIDILELIERNKHLLISCGGHKGAAGVLLELKNLEKFKCSLNAICEKISKENFKNNDEILGELNVNEIDFELLKIIEEFEPYGQKNPKPFFKISNLTLKNKKILGKDEKNLKLLFTKDNIHIEALFFNCEEDLKTNENISCIASISKNTFRGLITPQLIIKEIVN